MVKVSVFYKSICRNASGGLKTVEQKCQWANGVVKGGKQFFNISRIGKRLVSTKNHQKGRKIVQILKRGCPPGSVAKGMLQLNMLIVQ